MIIWPSRRAIAILAVLLAAPHVLRSQSPPLWGNLAPGPYDVGFRVISRYDSTRDFHPKETADGTDFRGERMRPMQVSIWYPAAHFRAGARLPFGRYVELLAHEDNRSLPNDSDASVARMKFRISVRRWLGESPSDSAVGKLLTTATGATAEPPPAPGQRFPLLLVAQGSCQSSLTHSVLCEYIASCGFVVATVPSMGPFSREMPVEPRGADTQTKDLEYVYGILRGWGAVDSKRLGVIGFSFGGFASLVESMRNPGVMVLISLDSNIGFFGAKEFLARMPDFDADRLRIPLLHFSQYDARGLDDSLIISLRHSDRTVIRVRGLTHFDFSSLGMLTAMIPGFVKTTRPEQQEGYESVCRHVLAFLQQHLQQGWRQEGGGPPPDFVPGTRGLLSVRHLDGARGAPAYEEFVDFIRTKGIAKGKMLYESRKRAAPNDPLFWETTLNRMGYEFLYAYGMTKEAIAVFTWNAEAYPKSFNVYDSLAEAYLEDGQTGPATANYRKSLELNPQNTNAANVLEKIGSGKK